MAAVPLDSVQDRKQGSELLELLNRCRDSKDTFRSKLKQTSQDATTQPACNDLQCCLPSCLSSYIIDGVLSSLKQLMQSMDQVVNSLVLAAAF